jgi:hypothetical protein
MEQRVADLIGVIAHQRHIWVDHGVISLLDAWVREITAAPRGLCGALAVSGARYQDGR